MAVNKMGLRFCPGCTELSEASHQACPKCGQSLDGMPVIEVLTSRELQGRGSDREPRRVSSLAGAVPGGVRPNQPENDLERRADVPRQTETPTRTMRSSS